MNLIDLIRLGVNALDVMIITRLPYSWQSKINDRRLEKIIRYARENSGYYRERIPQNRNSLTDIPTTTKLDIMENFDSTVTDPRLSKDFVLEEKEKNPTGCKLLGKYSISATSGSTGNPIICVQDTSMTQRQFVSLINYCHFPCVMMCMPGYGVMSTNHDANSKSSSLVRSLSRTFSCYLPPEELAKELNRCRPGAIMSYGSLLENLADVAEQGLLKIQPKVIMASGDRLSPTGKQRLQRAFPKAQILSTYACTEGGVLAVECGCGHLHIREDLVRVEPLDADGKPVADGVLSDRIAVTGYFNFVQPVIRYVVEDRVRFHHGCECGNRSPWIELEGRSGGEWSFYTSDGSVKKVPTHNLLCLIEDVSDDGYRYYSHYQMILHEGKANRIEIRLNYYPDTDKNAVRQKIEKHFTEYFSSVGITVQIELSDLPPQKSVTTGKSQPLLVVKDEVTVR